MPRPVSATSFAATSATGIFHNLAARGFQEGYYPAPQEMGDMLRQAGLMHVETVSLRGIANMLETQLQTIRSQDPDLYAAILKTIEATATEPVVVSMSGHAVCIAGR